MFKFEFKPVSDKKDLINLRDFLVSQSLGYPGYEDWIERSMFEIELEYKKTVLAYFNNEIVGDIIVQPEKEMDKVLELKNARVHPSIRGRHVMSFLMKQAEKEYAKGFEMILVDVRTTQKDMLGFFRSYGFREITKIPLYEKSVPEVVMVKDLKVSSGLEQKVYNGIMSRGL